MDFYGFSVLTEVWKNHSEKVFREIYGKYAGPCSVSASYKLSDCPTGRLSVPWVAAGFDLVFL